MSTFYFAFSKAKGRIRFPPFITKKTYNHQLFFLSSGFEVAELASAGVAGASVDEEGVATETPVDKEDATGDAVDLVGATEEGKLAADTVPDAPKENKILL